MNWRVRWTGWTVRPGFLVPRPIEWRHLAAEREERALRVRLAPQPVAELVDERALERIGEELSGVAQRQRRALDQFAGVLPSPIQHLVFREHLIDHAPLLGLVRAELLAGQQEVARAVVPGEDAPDHVLPVAGNLTARKMRRILEVGVLRGQDDVAHDGHLRVHIARPVDGADHRDIHVEHVEDQMPCIPSLLIELVQPADVGHRLVYGFFGRFAVGQPTPVRVVVLARPGVDQHLDLAVPRDVGERIRHFVVRLPAPHQTVTVGMALHEQDAVVGQFEMCSWRTLF